MVEKELDQSQPTEEPERKKYSRMLDMSSCAKLDAATPSMMRCRPDRWGGSHPSPDFSRSGMPPSPPQSFTSSAAGRDMSDVTPNTPRYQWEKHR